MGEVGEAAGAGARGRRAGSAGDARSRSGAGALQSFVAGIGGGALVGGGGRRKTAQPFEQHQSSFFDVVVVVAVAVDVDAVAIVIAASMRSVLVEGVDEAESATQRRHHRTVADDAAAVAAGPLVEVGDGVGGVGGRLLRGDRLQAAVDFSAQRS